MSENVKINIIEKDNTSPAGSGIDSTDIVFVPGFSVLPSAPSNPTLITSTLEFEKVFGEDPRVLTSRDITEKYEGYGFRVGDKDRSYVYAKELLYQGMPVLYANVDKRTFDSLEINDDLDVLECKNSSDCLTVEKSGKNVIRISSAIDRDNETIKIQFGTTYRVERTENSNPEASTFEYVLQSKSENCNIIDYAVDDTSFDDAKNCVVHELSANQYEIITAEPTELKKIVIVATLKLTLKKGEYVDIEVNQPTASVLDVFYGDNPAINDLWKISSAEFPVNNTIADKSVYAVKYITSGGYPSIVKNDERSAAQKFASEMLRAASHRGDAVALIDYQEDLEETVFTVGKEGDSFYSKLHPVLSALPDQEYGAAMYPWGIYNCGSTLTDNPLISMPASFGYMMCVAKAIKSSPNWLAMAGVSRGIVPGLQKLLVRDNVISNAIAEEMQPKFGVEDHNISINTITNIRPYGLTLWGNRTLKPVNKEGTVALNFLNTRNMLSDIKKLLYTTAKSCMFEQNSTDLWLKFKGGIEPLLRRLKAGNGISNYQIVRGTTKYNGDPLTKGEIAAVIRVYPMYAVEYFELAVEINDEDVTVS